MPRGQVTGRSRANVPKPKPLRPPPTQKEIEARTTPPRAPTPPTPPPPTPPIYDVQSIQTIASAPVWTTTPPGDIIEPSLLGRAAESERFSPFATEFLQQEFGPGGLYGSPFDPRSFDPTLTSTSTSIGTPYDVQSIQSIQQTLPTSKYPASFGFERPYYLDSREMQMIEERIMRVGTQIANGELPYSVTTFDQGALGITDEELMAAGYFQQMNGTWIRGTADEGIGGFSSGVSSGSSSRPSSYYGGYPTIGGTTPRFSAWGLTMWRIT